MATQEHMIFYEEAPSRYMFTVDLHNSQRYSYGQAESQSPRSQQMTSRIIRMIFMTGYYGPMEAST